MRDRNTNRETRAMKMNATQIEQTLRQLDAQAIPAEHPAILQLERLFGDHTYFLDRNGLSIVEPVAAEQPDGHMESWWFSPTGRTGPRRRCSRMRRKRPIA